MKDQANLQPTSTPTPAPTPEPPSGPPEKYEFKLVEGQTIDQSMLDKATPVFKDLGLTQDRAQKLVDLFNSYAKDQSDLAIKAVHEMRTGWREQVNAHPEMSGKLEVIKADVGRMKDSVLGAPGTPARDKFDAAMSLTGAGDHPDIVWGWWQASKSFGEGKHVSGSGPSKEGQRPPNASERPSLAAALYPDLAH